MERLERDDEEDAELAAITYGQPIDMVAGRRFGSCIPRNEFVAASDVAQEINVVPWLTKGKALECVGLGECKQSSHASPAFQGGGAIRRQRVRQADTELLADRRRVGIYDRSGQHVADTPSCVPMRE
jgi:hypothetical protein